jgi:hypothetical protein
VGVEAIAWWAIPIGATLVAIVWVSLVSRPKPRADPHDSVAEYARFRAALDSSRGTAGPPPAERSRDRQKWDR